MLVSYICFIIMEKTELLFSIQTIYCFESYFILEVKMGVNTYLLTVSKD